MARVGQELENLQERFVRDPGRYFVEFGNALLAAGRFEDAISVGAEGLRLNPEDMPGRVMVAQGFMALQQWKEAQAELLRVVKTDKNHFQAFRNLGEVLLRRQDYERAIPILEHAAKLSPNDNVVSMMMAHAAARRALPEGDLSPPPSMPRNPGPSGGPSKQPVLARVEPQRIEVKRPAAPQEKKTRRSDGRERDEEAVREIEIHRPPPTEHPFEPEEGGTEELSGIDLIALQKNTQSAPAPGRNVFLPERERKPQPSGGAESPKPRGQVGSGQGDAKVMPRVFSAHKPVDAARAALRASAAVGEHHLTNLLRGGLVDIPGVPMRDLPAKVSTYRSWTTPLAKKLLFVASAALACVVVTGGWMWYTGQQRKEDQKRGVRGATSILLMADHAGLQQSIDELIKVGGDSPPKRVVSALALAQTLRFYLYGEGTLDKLNAEVDGLWQPFRGKKLDANPVTRDVLLAKATLLNLTPQGPAAADAETWNAFSAWVDTQPGDGLAHWIRGEGRLHNNQRDAAMTDFALAKTLAGGEVLSLISLGDLELDGGEAGAALALYEQALSISPKHPWALIGRVFAKLEKNSDDESMVSDFSIGLSGDLGPTVGHWKQIGQAMMYSRQEDYVSLEKLAPTLGSINEPRLYARAVVLFAELGKIDLLNNVAAKIAATDNSPWARLARAEVKLAAGDAEAALGEVGDTLGWRAALTRGRALFDKKDFAGAAPLLDTAQKEMPTNWCKAWFAASVLAQNNELAAEKVNELDSLARKSKSKVPRTLHGLALLQTGDIAGAEEKLRQSVTDLSTDYPNALAYRAYFELAKLAANKIGNGSAEEYQKQAKSLNPGYRRSN